VAEAGHSVVAAVLRQYDTVKTGLHKGLFLNEEFFFSRTSRSK